MAGAIISKPEPSCSKIQRSREEDAEPSCSGAACVICLNQELTDPTILDCCQHIFCYDCINQWLLTNPSCPMCKKHLNKIKHGLTPVPTSFPVEYSSVDGIEKCVEDMLADYEMGFLRELGYTPLTNERVFIQERLEQLYTRTIRLRSLAGEADITYDDIEQKRTALNEEIKNLTLLKTMVQNRTKRSVIFNTPTFRRLIYSANLTPRPRLSPRFPADTSPAGVITNEALFRRRLIPFLIRELTAIIEREAIDMTKYLDMVMQYLKALRTTERRTVAHRLQLAGISHPIQFLNNISQFLSSGQCMEVYDENCEYRVRGAEIRSFFNGVSDNDVEFLNETITLGNGGARQLRPIDGWAENMRREYYSSVANNPPAPNSPPLIVLDDMPNHEPDLDFLRIRRRGSNSDIRSFFSGPSPADNDVEFLNEAMAFGGGGHHPFRRNAGSWARRPLSFNTPPSPVPAQVITLDEPQNNDSDVEVIPPTTTTDSSSNPAPKRPRMSSPDSH